MTNRIYKYITQNTSTSFSSISPFPSGGLTTTMFVPDRWSLAGSLTNAEGFALAGAFQFLDNAANINGSFAECIQSGSAAQGAFLTGVAHLGVFLKLPIMTALTLVTFDLSAYNRIPFKIQLSNSVIQKDDQWHFYTIPALALGPSNISYFDAYSLTIAELDTITLTFNRMPNDGTGNFGFGGIVMVFNADLPNVRNQYK